MKIEISRDGTFEAFEVESEIVLFALEEIKKFDATLSFRSGCRSGVCGSCAIRVDGVEKLACECKIKGGEKIEPLRYHNILKDLVVELDIALDSLKSFGACGDDLKSSKMSKDELEVIEIQSDCILCHSCYSACPIYEVNKNFAGPFTLSRIFRYEYDVRENDKKSKIERIQKDGIWDCTLCGECSLVCPQGLDPKGDIANLRAKSGVMGYMDPNMSAMNFGGFDAGYGFNP